MVPFGNQIIDLVRLNFDEYLDELLVRRLITEDTIELNYDRTTYLWDVETIEDRIAQKITVFDAGEL